MIHHHPEGFISFPFAAILMSSPWWMPWITGAIEKFHWISGNFILPALGIVLAILQIWYVIRRHTSL